MKRSLTTLIQGRILVICLAIVTAFACALITLAPKPAEAAAGDIVRGTLTGQLALYDAPEDGANIVDYKYAGFTFQAIDGGNGWYGATYNGSPVYFNDTNVLSFYTSSDSTIYHAAVIGGSLAVLNAPSSYAETITTLSNGATIQFCKFNDNYYFASYNGSIVYIDASRVSIYNPTESGTLVRWAGYDGVNVYEAPDTSSTVLAYFETGTKLNFASFNADWLMANMTVDGSTRTVFVPTWQVLTEAPVIESPDSGSGDSGSSGSTDSGNSGGSSSGNSGSGSGSTTASETTWIIATTSASGMSSASWDSSYLTSFSKGTVLTGLSMGNGWYKVTYDGQTMYVSSGEVKEIPSSYYSIYYQYYDITLSQMLSYQNDGSWIVGNTSVKASSSELLTYLDPSNFPEGTSGFFQFAVLTSTMGISVDTLNAQLSGKGILEGQGQAFHDGCYEYGVNEAYLVSLALHETGNGTSNLAKGVWYDPSTQTASYTETEGSTLVYNMFGIGAVDSNPLNGGAKYAYEHGWTTPYDAIVGGAKFVANSYLAAGSDTMSGQNTLYKMLYHPEYAATYRTKPWHEYATDVAWAYSQTHFYTQMLADYDYYSLVFEVPSYAG